MNIKLITMGKMKMNSWQWQKKGEPENLVLKESNIPELGKDEILIQNTFIGLNPVDWKLIENGHPDWEINHIPGVDGAGIVIKVGDNMEHLQLVSRVCYHTDLSKAGSFSTHTIVKGNSIMTIPNNLNDAAAAAFPCPSLTAFQAFQKIPSLLNKKVLVSGAGGSVGYFLTQLLLESGAKVYVTAGKLHHQEFLKMGVLKVLDYKDKDWKKEMKKSLQGNLFDVVFDTVSGAHAEGLLDLVSYYGHMVAIQDRIKENLLSPFTTCVSLHEIALGAFHKYASQQQIAHLLQNGEKLLCKIRTGILKQREFKITTFDRLPQHLAEMKKNNLSTKYLVKL